MCLSHQQSEALPVCIEGGRQKGGGCGVERGGRNILQSSSLMDSQLHLRQATSRMGVQRQNASFMQRMDSFDNLPEDDMLGRTNDDDESPQENPQFGKALYDFTAGGDEEVGDTLQIVFIKSSIYYYYYYLKSSKFITVSTISEIYGVLAVSAKPYSWRGTRDRV